jgi:plastocyanin
MPANPVRRIMRIQALSSHGFTPAALRMREPLRNSFLERVKSLLYPAALVALVSCTGESAKAKPAYMPRSRELTVTTVPLLVREQESVFPFLKAARAKGGVLDGHEVYAFSPSSLTVVEGDTIQFTLINPEDDVHSFVLPDLGVSLPGNTIVKKTYIAKRAGIFPILCAVQSHLPMMSGQLVVLPAAVMAGADVPLPSTK